VQIVEFSLQRYRSIQKAEKIRLGDLTILIGPNNEGKSNILQGLVTGMRLLASTPGQAKAGRQATTQTRYRARRGEYDWERDFPIGLQESKPEGTTTFDFVFELSEDEVAEFQAEVKSKLNGTLPIRLTASADSLIFEVRKKGPGGKALTDKRGAIAGFVARRINPQAIPSIRTAQESMRIVDSMVQRELLSLSESAEYVAAMKKVAELQRPILDEIGKNLRQMLNTFLPDVSAVHVDVRDRDQRFSECEIIVDDGTNTDLRHKGDGVQSLAAISLIHHVAQQSTASREIVLALEEPEAHLHPRAIHQVRRVLQEIASRQQVILTTHSPLLVNRSSIASNVIVHRKRAAPAQSIDQIRDVLGVRVADNLSAAEIVLVVEGSDDVTALEALLPANSSAVRGALEEGRLAIDGMHGTGNLRYRLALMADQLCTAHVLLDHDRAGLDASAAARNDGLLEYADQTFASSIGMKESEFEDWIDMDRYCAAVKRKFNVDLSTATFRKRKKKWSARVEHEFRQAGQLWDDHVQAAVKNTVASLVAAAPGNALKAEWSTAFDGLVAALEEKLQR
jgi:putative ATP-dependent endonuclease of the OLD family